MRTLTILILALMIAGCGGRSQIGAPARKDSGPVGQKDSAPPASCKAPAMFSSLEPLLDALNKLTYQSYGRYSSTVLKVSDDHQFSASLEVEANKVKVPSNCGTYGCRPKVTFVMINSPKGVTCLQQESVAWFTGCAKLRIQGGAALRFRGAIVDTHPGAYNFAPVIYVHPRCKTPCKAGQQRCQASNICFGDFNEFCRLCQARDIQECACHTEKGPMAEGAQCHYATSGDTSKGGKCTGGFCK